MDPLRAGHVAVIGGRFLYFCDRSCKGQYLLSLVDRLPDDGRTVEPPAVAFAAVAPGNGSATPAPPSVEVDAPPASRSALVAARDVAARAAVDGTATNGGSASGAGIAAAVSSSPPSGGPISSIAFPSTASPASTSSPASAATAPSLGAPGPASNGPAPSSPALVAPPAERGPEAPPSDHVTTGSLLEKGGPPSAPAIGAPSTGVRASDRSPRALPESERRLGFALAPPLYAVVALMATWLFGTADLPDAILVAGLALVAFAIAELLLARSRGESREPAATPGLVLRKARQSLERVSLGVAVAALAMTLATGGGIAHALVVSAAAFAALGVHFVVLAVARQKRNTVIAAVAEGIRYRDADAFDRTAQVDRALFCATSTLFTGEPQVVAVEPVGAATHERLLELAAAAAVVADHAAARVLVETAAQHGAQPAELRNVNVRRDEGVVAVCSTGERLVFGGRTFQLREHVSVAMADARVSELEAEGRTVLLVAAGDKILGLVALQEGMREGARAAVQRLLDARIEPVLLSHDARATCEALARSLDIEHIRPELLPEDVGREVRDLAEGVHVVAVVGDPARDQAALAAASVPIAFGRAGHTGDWPVTVSARDPRLAALAVTIPRKYREAARTCFAIGIAPGVIGAVGLFLGLLPPVAGPLLALVGGVASFAYAARSAVGSQASRGG